MLRRIAEMNINNLMLARFVKSGDYLKMEYSCPLTDTHPHKIHAIIHNICLIGDKYDDELCTRFNAERCYTPKVTPFTPDEVDTVYDALHTIGQLALNAAADYSSQRRYVYAWTILSGAIHQFTFIANPQGQLINEIEKAIESMNDERPIEELVSRGTSFLKKLLSMPKEKLAEDLYTVEMMVSIKPNAPLRVCRMISRVSTKVSPKPCRRETMTGGRAHLLLILSAARRKQYLSAARISHHHRPARERRPAA